MYMVLGIITAAPYSSFQFSASAHKSRGNRSSCFGDKVVQRDGQKKCCYLDRLYTYMHLVKTCHFDWILYNTLLLR